MYRYIYIYNLIKENKDKGKTKYQRRSHYVCNFYDLKICNQDDDREQCLKDFS